MEMVVIASLMIIPLFVALLLLVLRNDMVRTVLVIASVVLLVALALVLAAQYLFSPSGFVIAEAVFIDYVTMGVSLVCCFYIVYCGIRASNYLAIFLAALQCLLVVFYEFGVAHPSGGTDLYLDQLSLIMALIIAIVGGAVCIYALGYMREYQGHLDEQKASDLILADEPSDIIDSSKLTQDRRNIFFALIFIFLGAMFAIVFSNRLSWLLTAWEVTTVCSFVLIGYPCTKEARKNSFKAVTVNLAGGLAFTLALIMVAGDGYQIFELDKLIAAGVDETFVLPLILIAFAGMTKAAQIPFQGWLLGAMVAPTPVSALLHSSTMVKAGVFILIKLAPALGWNLPGFFVVIVGVLSFLGCTALAISQSNAKRVLAYSTVANLGLIVCCAGVGTPEAAWAALFLLVFHAGAKALLFCCVGTAEHHLGSRDIERMDNIFVRIPWLATCLALGMMAMFIAPLGMLVSKWAALVSIIESGHVALVFILAFGSAMTFVIWAKWMGKILSVGQENQKLDIRVSALERVTLIGMALLLILVTLGIPLLSSYFVIPYLQEQGTLLLLPGWVSASNVLGNDNLVIMSIIFLVMLILLALQILKPHRKPNDTVYLSGVGIDSNERKYRNAMYKESEASQRNWYMDQIFGERVIGRQTTILVGVVMAIFFLIGIVLELMML